ncbi:MAG: RsiV family protein [Treponema sp.]|nr:RsiV family protein [Treponema sp.]
MIATSKLFVFLTGKSYRYRGLLSAAALILVIGLNAACTSEPPPAASPPPPLKFSSQTYKEVVELNIEGIDAKPQMAISLELIDLPEVPESSNAELRRTVRQFLRRNLYGGKEPGDYAKAIIDDLRTNYLKQTEIVKENPNLALAASMNWEYLEKVEVETLPEGAQNWVFSQSLYQIAGGAHGSSSKRYFVAGETGTDPLKVENFIQGGVESTALNALLTQALRRAKGLSDNTPLSQGGFFEDKVETPENFFISPDGIGFHWDPIQIAPYSEGQIEAVIPYAELADILTDQGRSLVAEPPAPPTAE